MKIVCAWCERDGDPGYLGDREPLESSATTHGICPSHTEQVLEDLPAQSYPKVEMVIGNSSWCDRTTDHQGTAWERSPIVPTRAR